MLISTLSARRTFGALGMVAALALVGCGQKDDAPATKGGPISLRRLTEPEYRQIIADVFGTTIKVPGRFEPDVRDNGLIAVGTSRESVAGTGLEEYDLTARGIAADRAQGSLLTYPRQPANEDALEILVERKKATTAPLHSSSASPPERTADKTDPPSEQDQTLPPRRTEASDRQV